MKHWRWIIRIIIVVAGTVLYFATRHGPPVTLCKTTTVRVPVIFNVNATEGKTSWDMSFEEKAMPLVAPDLAVLKDGSIYISDCGRHVLDEMVNHLLRSRQARCPGGWGYNDIRRNNKGGVTFVGECLQSKSFVL